MLARVLMIFKCVLEGEDPSALSADEVVMVQLVLLCSLLKGKAGATVRAVTVAFVSLMIFQAVFSSEGAIA